MKIYCINDECPNKPKGYAICTALMDATKCPKRETEKIGGNHEEDSENDRNLSV